MLTYLQQQNLTEYYTAITISIEEALRLDKMRGDNDRGFSYKPYYFIPEVVPHIEASINSAGYATNVDVEKAVMEDPVFAGLRPRAVQYYVYTAQCIRRAKLLEAYIERKKIELMDNGYVAATQETLDKLANTGKFVHHYREGFGEPIRVKLLQNSNGKLYWMKPRVRNSGYEASVGDYVKL